jgi:hypothetical protein
MRLPTTTLADLYIYISTRPGSQDGDSSTGASPSSSPWNVSLVGTTKNPHLFFAKVTARPFRAWSVTNSTFFFFLSHIRLRKRTRRLSLHERRQRAFRAVIVASTRVRSRTTCLSPLWATYTHHGRTNPTPVTPLSMGRGDPPGELQHVSEREEYPFTLRARYLITVRTTLRSPHTVGPSRVTRPWACLEPLSRVSGSSYTSDLVWTCLFTTVFILLAPSIPAIALRFQNGARGPALFNSNILLGNCAYDKVHPVFLPLANGAFGAYIPVTHHTAFNPIPIWRGILNEALHSLSAAVTTLQSLQHFALIRVVVVVRSFG